MLSELLSGLRARLLTSSSLAQETARDGQNLTNGFFQTVVIDETPAFILNNDLSRFLNFGQVESTDANSAVSVDAEDVQVFNFRSGSIDGNGAAAAGIEVVDGANADIRNFGSIAGEQNGVEFTGANSSGTLDNFSGGVISSDSRAVEIEGEGISVRNFGDIVGTGDQRNGTIYTNETAEDVSISNFSGGTVDAGAENSGAGISLQVGDVIGDVVSNTIFNGFGATIQGRGQEAANTGGAGDGIRINNGAEGTVSDTDIVNSGLISSESNQGTAGGIRIADGVAAEGRILNTETGVIEGVRNGLYIGEGQHDLDVLNFGTIQSGSRAVNIDGTGVDLVNGGDILGTGDQRNGTVYADSTADDFSVRNIVSGTIDAGEGNLGSGFGAEIGDAHDGANTFTLDNSGTIQGRGNAAAGGNLAGDGVRIGNVGNVGTTDATIVNTGEILSEGANGTVAGIRVVNGVNFQGELSNAGVIEGVQNGLYFGTGDHSGSRIVNEEAGLIASGSRALNIDGIGLNIENAGTIAGLGDQRNGTVYADSTAQDFVFTNLETGLVDVGLGNNGAGFSAELSAEGNNFTINNDGVILGDSVESAGSSLAGDGIRFERERVNGVLDGTTTGLFTGDINIGETGAVVSVGGGGTTAGIRFVNGVSFSGTINNDGLIGGVSNGLYFGNATPAGGGDFTGAVVNNNGSIESESRALNIDGTGLTVNNFGSILGTGDQRNGTVYSDGTADNYTFNNFGLVDAGLGNNGSAVSLQTGDVDGDVVSALIVNEEDGVFQGRGDAVEGNTVGDGLRLFSNQEDANFAGLVQNNGLIAGSEESDAAAGIRIDGGLNLLGAIINEGEITGIVNAIDAREAGDVTFVNDDEGVVNGNVLLGAGDDIVVDLGQINGVVDGGAGNDFLLGGNGDNVLVGGLGNDFIEGGDGIDTADFSDLDVAVNVNLGANGNGTATRDTGFNVSVTDQLVSDSAAFVMAAEAGNLYFNIHTSDFLGGEIRGQLTIVSDIGSGHDRVIELAGSLDAAQEPGPTSDSRATGEGTLTITFNQEGEAFYSSELSVVGLNEADLQTPVPGAVSAIHVHNAPAGQNGPILQDTLVDAGGIIDPNAPTGIVGPDVIENQIEVDVLSSIENVIGSDDGDVIFGSNLSNTLRGEDGDDLINGQGGDDILSGGAGSDTFTFEGDFGNDVITDFEVGSDRLDFSDFGPDFGLSLDVSQDGSDALLSFGSDASIRLDGVNSADLIEDDFIS